MRDVEEVVAVTVAGGEAALTTFILKIDKIFILTCNVFTAARGPGEGVTDPGAEEGDPGAGEGEIVTGVTTVEGGTGAMTAGGTAATPGTTGEGCEAPGDQDLL